VTGSLTHTSIAQPPFWTGAVIRATSEGAGPLAPADGIRLTMRRLNGARCRTCSPGRAHSRAIGFDDLAEAIAAVPVAKVAIDQCLDRKQAL
jgi:hypothetical protein